MRSPAILIVVCAVVLAGAYFASRMLVSDVPAPNPNVASVVAMPPDSVQAAEPPPAAMPTAGRPGVNLEEARQAMLAPRAGPLAQVNKPMPHAVEPVPPPDVAASPFQGESKELDYAEALLAEPNPTIERLKSAHEVLTRCLDLEPDNQRCKAAMTIAQNKLGPGAASERQPGLPTLQVPAPQKVPSPK